MAVEVAAELPASQRDTNPAAVSAEGLQTHAAVMCVGMHRSVSRGLRIC